MYILAFEYKNMQIMLCILVINADKKKQFLKAKRTNYIK